MSQRGREKAKKIVCMKRVKFLSFVTVVCIDIIVIPKITSREAPSLFCSTADPYNKKTRDQDKEIFTRDALVVGTRKNCLVLELANVLLLGDGHGALLDNGTTLDTSGGNNILVGLDAEDGEALLLPVEGNVGKDDEEADERGDEGDAGVGSIGNGTLDGREDSTTSDTHDEDTGTAAGVDTEVGSSHGEDGLKNHS